MPLTKLGKMFEEVVNSTPETVIHDPGWIFAQRCESRWITEGSDQTPVDCLLVYKSVMVRDSWDMYAPIREIICGARCMEVLGQGFVDDPEMMRGVGEFMVLRLTHEESFPEGPLTTEQLKNMISAAAAKALGAEEIGVNAA
ncbi:hypothetical protein PBI_ARISSANAE_73 [Mycobacterium phage Arissanae]|nr:hypothetical protein PBI_ARISSANAE_73 [Mycobacterium phage Arissanae]